MSTTVPATHDINKVMLTDEVRTKILALAREEEAIAQATPCDVPNCDGSMHEANAEPSEWWHRVSHKVTDNLELDITRHADGRYYGWMAIDIIDDASAADMRAYAADCAKQATDLLAAADLVDALNGEVKA